MIDSTLKQEILKQLDQLPPALQERVLAYAESLVGTTPKGRPGKELLSFAGTMNQDEAQAMAAIIEAECERVDLHEW